MKFDVEKMFEQTKRTAQEYSQQVAGEYIVYELSDILYYYTHAHIHTIWPHAYHVHYHTHMHKTYTRLLMSKA